MVMSKKEMGNLIKNARKLKSKNSGKRYTQEMLANDLNLSRGYIGDIENGRTYPNYVLLSKISEICGVPLSYFDENIEEQIKDATNRELRGTNELPGQTNLLGMFVDTSLDVVGKREYGYSDNSVILVPVYSNINGGQFDEKNIISHETMPIDMAGGKEYFGLVVPDNAMNNLKFFEDDIVIAQKQYKAVDGDPVIAVIDDDIIIREFYQTDGGITFTPNSIEKGFKPIFVDPAKNKVHILGKIIKFTGKV